MPFGEHRLGEYGEVAIVFLMSSGSCIWSILNVTRLFVEYQIDDPGRFFGFV